ncbi:MAG: AAA family ATPase [candidate division KSB1 bacterium]|nr:AAA family ATPase [candidate division KSB1 bacterium]
MVISRAFIRAYKSIFEMVLPVDPKITIMIGANESGKTNILKSILSFSPGAPFDNTLTCQYSDYYYQGKCPEVTLEFSEISKENRQNLLKFSDAFKDASSILITKRGPHLDDYEVYVGDKEVPISDMARFFRCCRKSCFLMISRC